MRAWRALLLPLNPLYRAVMATRALAYDRGLIRSTRLPVPVVSVGNISFGGTGKTPTTICLVRDLIARGWQPAVLSRGYGRSTTGPVVVVGPDDHLDAHQAGDEPVEMASRLPGVPIVVDGDRVAGGQRAIELGADILVLDDGFQHRRLERDLDLVLIDAGDPWGGGSLPPLGRLREPLRALRRATTVLVTKLPDDHTELFRQITAGVLEVAPGVNVLGSRLRATRVWIDGEWRPIEELKGRRVVAFAGIGRPQAFAEVIEKAGAEVVGHRWFTDHHQFSPADLQELRRLADGHDCQVITTAKDQTRLPADFPVVVVEISVEPLSGGWDDLWAHLDDRSQRSEPAASQSEGTLE